MQKSTSDLWPVITKWDDKCVSQQFHSYPHIYTIMRYIIVLLSSSSPPLATITCLNPGNYYFLSVFITRSLLFPPHVQPTLWLPPPPTLPCPLQPSRPHASLESTCHIRSVSKCFRVTLQWTAVDTGMRHGLTSRLHYRLCHFQPIGFPVAHLYTTVVSAGLAWERWRPSCWRWGWQNVDTRCRPLTSMRISTDRALSATAAN